MNNSIDKKGWFIRFVKTIIINLFLLLEIVLFYWKPIIACVVFLLVIVNIVIYCILRPFSELEEQIKEVIDLEELENATKLLRYATAVLAFISFLTTAEGMKNYVFTDEWQAYLGSFAVQSILVVFSLLLCHLYTVMGRNKYLGDWGKRMLLSALTLFFSISLVVSSVFSYSYISNNAYRDTWPGDAEAMIQNYLIRETTALQEENKRIGKRLLDHILNQVDEKLNLLVTTYTGKMNDSISNEIETFDLQDINITLDLFVADERIASLYRMYPANRRQEDLLGIEADYQKQYAEIMTCIGQYEQLVAQWRGRTSKRELDTNRKLLEDMSSQLLTIYEKVDSANSAMEEWGSYFYDEDVKTIRKNFTNGTKQFKNFITRQNQKVNNLLSSITETESVVSLSGEETIQGRLKNIRHNIYLLKVNSVSEVKNVVDVDEIVTEIINIYQEIASEDLVSDSDVEALVQLADELNEYGKYLKLSSDIQNYNDKNLSMTYSIFTDNKGNEESKEVPEGEVVAETGKEESEHSTVLKISEAEWREIRDQDFHILFSMLKELPDETVLSTQDHNTSELYEPEIVLKNAISFRRDMVGDITEFEKSINYFNSDYNKMAFFSAFMAVFFDLGAFLTGCFLYGVRYIHVGLETDKGHEETNAQKDASDEMNKIS